MTAVAMVPPPAGRPLVWMPLLEPLIVTPGAWAPIRTYDHAASAQQAAKDLRRGASGRGGAVVPAGQWEFRSGQGVPEEPVWAVWARYMGPWQVGDL